LNGFGLALTGVFFASFGNMMSLTNQKNNLPILQSNTWGMTYGALFMGMVMLIHGKSFTFDFTISYITSLFYLSTIGSVIAFACYFSLLNKIGAHKASYASIMFPAVAVVISTFMKVLCGIVTPLSVLFA
jgi:drug/metabolite transporter (DMT)-like permease